MLRVRVGVAVLVIALSACGSGAGKGDGGGGMTGGGGAAGNACSSCSATQYCSVTVGGAAGSQPSYACRELPAACVSNPTCACITSNNVGCGNLCSQADGGLTVTCQAP
jgi:hypothetical protein